MRSDRRLRTTREFLLTKRLLLCLAVAACGPTPYDHGSGPVAFAVTQDVPQRDAVVRATKRALTKLYGAAVEDSSAALRIAYEVTGCRPGVLGHVSSSAPRTVLVCPLAFAREPTFVLSARYAVAHELVHALGFGQHLDPSTGAVMAPRYEDWRGRVDAASLLLGAGPEDYTAADVEAMTEAGIR